MIYDHYDDRVPLYLLTLFAEGDKVYLTEAERDGLASRIGLFVSRWKSKEPMK